MAVPVISSSPVEIISNRCGGNARSHQRAAMTAIGGTCAELAPDRDREVEQQVRGDPPIRPACMAAARCGGRMPTKGLTTTRRCRCSTLGRDSQQGGGLFLAKKC